MFDGLGRRNDRNSKIRDIAVKSSENLLKLVKSRQNSGELIIELKQRFFALKIFAIFDKNGESEAVKFLTFIIKLDTAIEEMISRHYHKVYKQNPSTKKYYESMYELNFSKEEVFFIVNIRKIRNMFCHSYDLEKTYKFVFSTDHKYDLFDKCINGVLSIIQREYEQLSKKNSFINTDIQKLENVA